VASQVVLSSIGLVIKLVFHIKGILILMKIFWSKRSEVIGRKRKLLNEKLCKLYSLANANHMVKSKDDLELHGRADKCIELL
jgi:hypothetical protein